MDVLSDILDTIQLTSSYWYRTSFAGEWGIKFPQQEHIAKFHIITQGELWYEIPKLKIKALAEQGDILILFKSMEHSLASAPKVKPSDEFTFRTKAHLTDTQVLMYGDQKKHKANVVCGHFNFNGGRDHPFLNSLPNIVHIKNMDNSHSPWLSMLLNMIEHESKSDQPGRNSLVRKLTEIIFVQALRIHLNRSNKEEGFFRLIENPEISKTLEAIHQNLEKKWSLIKLAKIAGMSRTNYSVKFKELSGITPLDYLTYCRIEKAKQLLKESRISIPNISELVGYPTHEYFQKLFKKKTGTTPSAFRKLNSK